MVGQGAIGVGRGVERRQGRIVAPISLVSLRVMGSLDEEYQFSPVACRAQAGEEGRAFGTWICSLQSSVASQIIQMIY